MKYYHALDRLVRQHEKQTNKQITLRGYLSCKSHSHHSNKTHKCSQSGNLKKVITSKISKCLMKFRVDCSVIRVDTL